MYKTVIEKRGDLLWNIVSWGESVLMFIDNFIDPNPADESAKVLNRALDAGINATKGVW